MEHHRDFLNHRPRYHDFNWSIWEHQSAKIGDRYVLVRCKNKRVPGQYNQWGKPLWEPCADDTTGICMVGTFISNPYQGEDWSGKGRETYYVDLGIEHMSDPDECVIISTAELMAALPSFVWTGGRSGRLLDDVSAEKLESMIDGAVRARQARIWSPGSK